MLNSLLTSTQRFLAVCITYTLGSAWSLSSDAKCRRRDSIVAVLPRLDHAAMNSVAACVSANLYAAQAAKDAGWIAARAERTQ